MRSIKICTNSILQIIYTIAEGTTLSWLSIRPSLLKGEFYVASNNNNFIIYAAISLIYFDPRRIWNTYTRGNTSTRRYKFGESYLAETSAERCDPAQFRFFPTVSHETTRPSCPTYFGVSISSVTRRSRDCICIRAKYGSPRNYCRFKIRSCTRAFGQDGTCTRVSTRI